MGRIIMHIDMDAFFVSVELRDKPWLMGKPVAVAGNSNKRSVIATASYKARECGVHSAMPLFIAKRLCKNLVVLKTNIEKYSRISRELVTMYNSLCPAVEQFSIDEAFLDLTYTVKNFIEAKAFANKVKTEIKNKFGLPCTVGIGSNKLLTKLASKLGKPNGLFVINDENKENILKDLSVNKISGIGNKTVQKLYDEFGVKTLGNLRNIPIMELYSVFHSYAIFLHNASFGKDDSPVIPDYEKPQERSISHSTTFPFDTDDINYISKVLKYLSEKIGIRLRKKNLFAKSVIIVIRYSNFHTVSKSKRIFATDSTKIIYLEAISLFKNTYTGGKIRLVGVMVNHLCKDETLSLFEQEKKYKIIDSVLDKVKLKYGDSIADYGSLIGFKK
jgi:DNA polymerase-4